MSSAEYSCKLFKTIFAYRQTVWTLVRLLLKEQSDLGPHCLQKWLLKSQADDKADNNCCDWQFKGYYFTNILLKGNWYTFRGGNSVKYFSSLLIVKGKNLLLNAFFFQKRYWQQILSFYSRPLFRFQKGSALKGKNLLPFWEQMLSF